MDHSILLSVVQPVGAEAAADIVKDLGRTFPSMRRFATAEGQDTLRRVLRAYAALDPEVRSCGCAQAFCLGAHSSRRAVCACNVVGALPTWASQQSCCLLALSSRRHVCLRTLTGALSACAHSGRDAVCAQPQTRCLYAHSNLQQMRPCSGGANLSAAHSGEKEAVRNRKSPHALL